MLSSSKIVPIFSIAPVNLFTCSYSNRSKFASNVFHNKTIQILELAIFIRSWKRVFLSLWTSWNHNIYGAYFLFRLNVVAQRCSVKKVWPPTSLKRSPWQVSSKYFKKTFSKKYLQTAASICLENITQIYRDHLKCFL